MANTRIAQLLLEEGWNLHVNDDPSVPPVLLKMTQHCELLACPIDHDVIIDLYAQCLIVKKSKIGSVTVYCAAYRYEEPVVTMRFWLGLVFMCVLSWVIGFIISRFF